MKFTRVALLAVLFSTLALNFGSATEASTAPLPVVAIHVSEVTQALETLPATAPTPTGAGNSGFEWWYTSWHYFVMHESLKEALRSDGTPYVVVTDADITAGALLNPDGSPKYPIVISLASEAIRDNEVGPLRSYVSAGGFLFVGSSSFTRNPNGTTRGDFALGTEMGLHMAGTTLSNWYENGNFNKVVDHRLVSHIPYGSLVWHMPLTADQTPWGTTAGHSVHVNHYTWRVLGSGAEILANGGFGPLIATNGYGKGRFIFHGGMQPLLGSFSYDAGMYSYVIFRRAIEWAFEASNVPIVKLSPWRYPNDAAFVVRHDFENSAGSILSIEGSASFESSHGAKGDYFFCTGTLRVGSEDPQLDEASRLAGIQSLGRAVSLYGATIGSHNGGLPNPVNPAMPPGSYDYWHWGPDEAFETTPAGYLNGKDYAQTSIGMSYTDIEGWLSGLDNGRPGCGATADCPRIWVSPYFNSAREDSYDIFKNLNVTTTGEQKCGPFPHWTVSTRTPGMRYPQLTLPVSEWYVGSDIGQALDNHSSSSMRAAVDLYYSLGALVNIYTHNSASGGLPAEYVTYNVSKPRMWATNATGVYDWWTNRSTVTVTPSYSASGTVGIASATVAGATDPETAVEMVIPNWGSGAVADVQVWLNGGPVLPANYRLTDYGVKVRVGAGTSSTLEVRYTPLQTWTQSNWAGGSGQATWTDETRFDSSTGIDSSNAGQLRLPLSSGGSPLFTDDFTRAAPPAPVPFSWTLPTPTPSGSGGLFDTTGGVLNGSTIASGLYGFAYPAPILGDGSVEADIRFPTSAFGGGLMARVNTTSGQRYGAWIYPEASGNVLRMIRFSSWTGSWIALREVNLASVGTGWHHMKMTLTGGRIQVYYDNPTTPVIDVTDGSPLASGPTGIDFWTNGNTFGPILNNYVVRDGSNAVVFSDNFGSDPTDQLVPWTAQMGGWSVNGGVLQGSTVANQYGYAYYGAAWTNYTVEGRLQLPAGAFAGGIGGRLDAATGAHYAAWVYPDGSSGGSNVLKLIKYRSWTDWSAVPMQQVSLASVGTGWHTLKLGFDGTRIQVWYDGNQVVDTTDSGFDGRAAYLSGGVTLDTWQSSSAYVINVDDIVVRPPSTYGSNGTLLSSAFDGGVGVQWRTIAWDAAAGGTTGARIRTRTADRANLLSSAPWSAYYPASGSVLADNGQRWMQYELELTSADPAVTPNFYEMRVTYVPGIQLPGSNLTYTGPTSADSQADVTLTATLLDDDSAPIVGRTVSFTLDGLSAVSGVTGPAGLASTPLHLGIPPGAHTLTVAFAGDASYAPMTVVVPFTVNSPWLAWIQDTQADFQSNTPTDVDTATVPGSVLLGPTQVGAGEESGAFSVGGLPGWTYRRGLFVDNPNAVALRVGHSIKLVLDTASLVAAGKLLAGGDDLRVVYDDGTTQVELDRLAETPFNTAATELWFKTQAVIPASGREEHYFIYYGNPAAGAPPANPRNVWALWDGFDGSAVDTTIWQQTGSVTVSGGEAHLAVLSNLFGLTTYADTRFETRLKLSAQLLPYSAWWGWEETPSDAPNIIVFEEVATGLQGLMQRNSGGYAWIDMAAPPRTDWHTYAIRWWSGNAVWMIDGVPLITRSTNVPTIAQYANLNAPGVAYDVDFVRARFDAAVEPIVTLASPQTRYASEGRMLSIAYDTGRQSTWKYLTWDAATPTGTAVSLRVRTAVTQAALASAPWVPYAQSGLLISNGDGRWVQYEAILQTTDSAVTPELRKVTVYYGVAACDGTAAIAIADAIPGTPNQPVTVPITIGSVAGMGVYSSESHVTFDSNVLEATSVVMNSALNAYGCAIESSFDNGTTTPGQGHVRVAVFCTASLVGSQPLANVTFNVRGGTCGTTTALHFAGSKLNEGCPAAVPDDGSIVSKCDVSGAVYYYRNNGGIGSEPSTKPVPGVVVHPSGGGGNATTDGFGLYVLLNLAGDQTIAPLGKTGDFNAAIGSSDAAAVAMASVGSIPPLSANQFLAGDVTGNHTLSALDASNIARFAVGLVAQFPVAIAAGSDWTFLCDRYPNCIEGRYDFTPISQAATNRNFDAVLYGDVTGNWTASGPGFTVSRAAISSEEDKALLRDRAVADRFRREGAPPAVERRPGMPAAELSLTGWKPLRAGERRQLTVDLRNADGILGLDLVLKYDPSRLAIVGVEATGIGSALSVARGDRNGTQRIAAYGYAALSGSGSILTITVEGLGNNGRQQPPTIGGVANEGAVPLEVRGIGREPLPGR